MSGQIKDIGEEGVIALARSVKYHSAKRLLKGIGDDCAVIRGAGNSALLVTTDVMLDGVHFAYEWCPPESVGAKLLAVNLSDIAAMGGKPEDAFLCLMLPENLAANWVESFFYGFNKIAQRYGVNLAGGDVSRHPDRITLALTLTGRMRRDEVVYRSRAREGDFIYVSGTLGDAEAGMTLLQAQKSTTPFASYLINRYLYPDPRLELGRLLARTRTATAMIDLSDGLAIGVRQLAQASRLSAEIEVDNIPVSEELTTFISIKNNHNHHPSQSLKPKAQSLMPKAQSLFPQEFALRAGGDYELLFTVKPENVRRVERFHLNHPELPQLTHIGTMKENKTDNDEWTNVLGNGGWKHFR